MKTKIMMVVALLAMNQLSPAALYTSGSLTGTTIPDNNGIGTGTTLSYTPSTIDPGGNGVVWITGLTLNFVLQGGDANDLTGYLRLGNTSGSPAYDLTGLIHGQSLNASSGTSYTIDFASSGFATTFGGLDPNHAWTLFFADGVNGDTTTVNGWSLDITAVPEPTNVAFAIFLGVVGIVSLRSKLSKYLARIRA